MPIGRTFRLSDLPRDRYFFVSLPPPRPLFLYGTLRALPLLAWVVTGNSQRTDSILPLIRASASLKGYARVSLLGRDYPALIKRDEASASVDGVLFVPENRSQRAKLDDFEGECYTLTSVDVTLGDSDSVVEADVYVWNGEGDMLTDEPWDLNQFISDRLEDWLECFAGMEMVGDETSASDQNH